MKNQISDEWVVPQAGVRTSTSFQTTDFEFSQAGGWPPCLSCFFTESAAYPLDSYCNSIDKSGRRA